MGEVLAAKPNDPSSILEHHTVEGENQYPEIVLWPPQPLCNMHLYMHIKKMLTKTSEVTWLDWRGGLVDKAPDVEAWKLELEALEPT